MNEHPLRQWRKKNKVILADFAKLTKTTPSSISRVERGKQVPSLSLVMRICAATKNELPLLSFLIEYNDQA
jgi:transcriptional regulator with XRE-family HTH domain